MRATFRTLTRPAALLTLLALVLSPLTVRAAEPALPDVVNIAPADAEVVVIIPNLAKASKRITEFATALGGKDVIGGIADPLAALKDGLGVVKGLKEDGSVMVVVYDLVTSMQQQVEPPFVVAIPVTDYKAFLGNFSDAKEKDGIAEAETPDGEPIYARGIGNFAVLSTDRDRLAAYKPGNAQETLAKSAGTLGSTLMAGTDVAVYINVKALTGPLRPELKNAREDFERQLPNPDSLGGLQGEVAGLQKWLGGTFFNVFDALLRDGESLVIGVDLSGDGIALSLAAQFQPGSKLAKQFKGGKADAGAMLAKLPGDPYLFASSFDFAGIDIQGMVDDLVADMPKGGLIASTLRDSIASMANQQRTASAYYVGPAGIMGGFSSVNVVQPANVKEYLKANKAAIDAMGKSKIDLGQDEEGNPLAITFATQYREDVHEIEGVSVSQYVVQANMPKAVIAQLGPAAGMITAMGLTQQSGYVANVNGQVITTSKPDLALITKSIKAAKSDSGLGKNAMLSKVRKAGVPAGSAMEFYLNVGGIVEMVNPFLPFIPNMELSPIAVPKDLVPLALSGQAQDGGLGAKLFMPMPMVTWIKDTAMNLQNGGNTPRRDPSKGPPEAPF